MHAIDTAALELLALVAHAYCSQPPHGFSKATPSKPSTQPTQPFTTYSVHTLGFNPHSTLGCGISVSTLQIRKLRPEEVGKLVANSPRGLAKGRLVTLSSLIKYLPFLTCPSASGPLTPEIQHLEHATVYHHGFHF